MKTVRTLTLLIASLFIINSCNTKGNEDVKPETVPLTSQQGLKLSGHCPDPSACFNCVDLYFDPYIQMLQSYYDCEYPPLTPGCTKPEYYEYGPFNIDETNQITTHYYEFGAFAVFLDQVQSDLEHLDWKDCLNGSSVIDHIEFIYSSDPSTHIQYMVYTQCCPRILPD